MAKLPTGDLKKMVKKQAKKRLLKWLIPALLAYVGPLMVIGALVAIVISLIAPFLKVISWLGFSGSDKSYVQQIASQNLGGGSLKDTLEQLLDCRNVSPEDAKQGYCIETGFTEASPIPDSASWLVPVWQAAGDQYHVPWQLLAAIAGARTNFGAFDCSGDGGNSSMSGEGYYRLDKSIWKQFKQDAGRAEDDPSDGNPDIGVSLKGFKCYTSTEPSGKWQEKDGKAVYYDAVDQTFALAQALRDGKTNIAKAKLGIDPTTPDWSDYSGGDPSSCTVNKDQDGPVWEWQPDSAFSGADEGWNEKLKLPQNILALGAHYTVATWTQENFPPTFGQVPGELLDPQQMQRNGDAVPHSVEVQFINSIGQALNLPDNVINQVRPGLMRAIDTESGFKAAIVEHAGLSDLNSNGNQQASYPTLTRGLFQFTPGTFWSWHVPGFNNIYNPIDNTLAAMVSMRYADSVTGNEGATSIPPYGDWLNGGGSWGPHGGSNPFADTQGSSTTASTIADVSGSTANVTLVSQNKNPVAYQGASPNDPISQAVAYLGGYQSRDSLGVPSWRNASDCYTSIVHEWYQAILENPPGADAATGSLAKMIEIARSQLGVHEIGDTNTGPQVDQFLKSVNTSPGNPWCAAFVSWSAQQAGVKLGPDPADIGSAGVAQITEWAALKGIWTPGILGPPPQPGDLVAFGSNDHIGIIAEVHPGYLITIEGNYSNQVEYVHRVPASSGIEGYIRLSKLYGAAGGQTPAGGLVAADGSGSTN